MPQSVIMFTQDELSAFVNEIKETIRTEIRQQMENAIKPKQQKTWLTRKEAIEITGLSLATFDRRIKQLGIEKKLLDNQKPKYHITDIQKITL